jgi:hypothetical protein
MQTRTVVAAILLFAPLTACNKRSREFTSSEWNFAVRFPSEPKKAISSQNIPGMGEVPLTRFNAYDRGVGFMVTVYEVPVRSKDPDSVVEERAYAAHESALPSLGATLTSSKTVMLGKHRGREMTARLTDPANGSLWTRAYLVGARMYQVVAVGTADAPTGSSQRAIDFLDSFRLLE